MYLASEIDDKELLKNVVLDTYNNLKKNNLFNDVTCF